ncbi:MAG: ABC transporter ATP-binding protein, partial [Nitrososphaerales archaeon]
MATIRVEDVEKTYGDSKALNRVSFTVSNGEFSVLLGPSGCGKTTLLRCIAGLERPDSGHIYIGDEKVDLFPPGQRDIAMVFQTVSLFPHMTVAENISFPLKVRGSSVQAMGDKVREVAKLLSIEGLLDKAPKELSGGEQQRVEIGRAIAREPKAFLMDEPLSSLDSPLRAQLRGELKRIQREVGATILYVTHDQAEALALADRIGVMNRGALLQYDKAQNVFEKPSSAFVAKFVGDPQANVMNVKVVRVDGNADLSQQSQTYAIVGEGFRSSIPGTIARDILEKAKVLQQEGPQADGAIQVSIRPEDIQIATSPGDSGGEVKGRVVMDETLTLYR